MSASLPHPLRFQIGARTLFSVRRRLVRIGLSLNEALEGNTVPLPPLEERDQGYLVTSLPAAQLSGLLCQCPSLIPFVQQNYYRRFADLELGFEAYMAQFSAKNRNTLQRKLRKFAEFSGSAPDVRCYRTPEEITQFHSLAREVSRKTYQERLLDAGLPYGAEAMGRMRRLASQDRVRAWLLFLHGEPISYLYAPAKGDTLIYAYLGYDRAHAALSPGTVLQVEAMRELMTEGRFRRFDFTEGDGQHKRQLSTGSVDCVNLLLLRKTSANRLLIASLRTFDVGVSLAKATIGQLGLDRVVARALSG